MEHHRSRKKRTNIIKTLIKNRIWWSSKNNKIGEEIQMQIRDINH